ncbi:MAG TPA: chemotaxis protein CheA [Bryobacteraceae bacterium]|nr:chemotaxis protein CheA [Bryobacteraceae bacterium]
MAQSAELRQQIENLALRLVVGEPHSPGGDGAALAAWIPVLQNIHQQASADRSPEVVEAAAAMIKTVTMAGSRPDDAAGQLQEAITRLQQALDAEVPGSQSSDQAPAQDAELLSDFILESREHLASLETQVLIIETDPHNSEALHSVFRSFHTIKGLAGFLELWEVQKAAHEVESFLDQARNGQLIITTAAIDVILQSADYLRRWLRHLESVMQQEPSEAPGRDEALLARIKALSTPAGSAAGDSSLRELAAAVETPPQQPLAAVEPTEGKRRAEAMAVKVDTAKLDYLVDMAGEMVIAESLVRHDPDLGMVKSPRLQRNMAQLARITAELQKTAMSMRLVPIGPLFRRMARLVRDLARQFGKRVEMQMQGEDIELDRTIVEELADPLMHMVRNAMDHGIELPQEREARGKNRTARLMLKAHHQAGQVVIEVADDGCGLDRDRIKAKAVQKRLVAPGQELSDTEIYNLIFEPGFSTAAQVTNVSGRGVGMDVVRRHIEKLRGRIEIRSTPGVGATFVLKLPLTLAIIDGLVVGVGKERYIVPLFAVREMFRPAQDTIWTVQQRAEMALVRGGLMPVLRLYRRFRVAPRSEKATDNVLVVAETEGHRFCLMVDELIGKQEVVIKSLGETFKNVPGVAGGAILGDGRVGLILDLDRLYKEGSRTDAGR